METLRTYGAQDDQDGCDPYEHLGDVPDHHHQDHRQHCTTQGRQQFDVIPIHLTLDLMLYFVYFWQCNIMCNVCLD